MTKEEIKLFDEMKKSGLTEEQVNAIYNFMDFKLIGFGKYIRDIELQDLETKIVRLLKGHGHVGDRVLVPIK